jgi:ubiquinone/menaquinone biosynthesis C-methylase UbiE
MFADELPHDEATRLAQAYAPLRTFEQRMTSPGFRRMLDERDDAMAEALFHRLDKPLSECRILDVGCGSGRVMNWLAQHGASPRKMVGIDLQADRIALARRSYPDLTFIEGTGEVLPFPGREFDIVLAFTLFSSVTDPIIARQISVEIAYALKPGGVILWYDMRYPNPANPNLRAMTLPRIRQLFPGFTLELESLTLLPPLAERLGSLTDALYPILASIPPLRSHYFGLLRS